MLFRLNGCADYRPQCFGYGNRCSNFYHVAQDEGVDITFMARSSVMKGVIIHVAADRDLPAAYADDLRDIVRAEMHSDDIPVYVVCLRGQWLRRFETAD